MSNWQTVRMLAKRWPWIVAATLLCAVALWSSAQFNRQVRYSASASLLLLQASSDQTGGTQFSGNNEAALLLMNSTLFSGYSKAELSQMNSKQFRDSVAQQPNLTSDQVAQLSADTDLADTILRFTCVADTDKGAQDVVNAALAVAQKTLPAPLPLMVQMPVQATSAQPVGPADGGKTRGAQGAALGFALSLCVLLLRYYLSDTIKNAREVNELLGRPVLAELPRARDDSDAAEVHAQRLRRRVEGLAVHLRYGERGEGGTIAVISARRGEGKTAVAAGLAEALTAGASTVLLMDLDWTNPSLQKYYKLNPTAGAADVLTGACVLQQAALPVAKVPGLSVLSAGSGACDSAEAMQGLLSQATAGYDFVVAALPAIRNNAYATATARLMDRVLFVARTESTTLRSAQVSLDLLDAAGARVRGVALTDA